MSICDISEGAIEPEFFIQHFSGIDIKYETVQWIKNSTNLFYAWHWYGKPSDRVISFNRMVSLSN
jgi:recombinational DNA repair protein (RecF pathway)